MVIDRYSRSSGLGRETLPDQMKMPLLARNRVKSRAEHPLFLFHYLHPIVVVLLQRIRYYPAFQNAMSREASTPPSSSDLIDQRNLDNDDAKEILTLDPVTVQRELNTTLDSETTRHLMVTQIRSLAEKTLKTRAAFENISRLLGNFDSMGLRDAQNNAVETLRPDWEILRTVSTVTSVSIVVYSSFT